MSERTIYFIWDAEKTIKGRIIDLIDGIKNTHSCSLCCIAYGRLRPKPKWISYKAELKSKHKVLPVQYYINQLPDELAKIVNNDFPSVVGLDPDKNLSILMDGKTIKQCGGDLDKFIAMMNQIVADWV